MPHDLFAALDHEWTRLTSRPGSERHLQRWASAHPNFATVGPLATLPARLRTGGAENKRLLHDLARLAATDDLAARTILQTILPSLIRLAERSGRGDPDAVDTLGALAWIEVRQYPCHRDGHVAANLYWDIRKRYLATRNEVTPTANCAALEATSPSAEAEALHRLAVTDVQATLVRVGESADSFDLLWTTRAEGHTCADVARTTGRSRHGLVQRRRRVEAMLRSCLAS